MNKIYVKLHKICEYLINTSKQKIDKHFKKVATSLETRLRVCKCVLTLDVKQFLVGIFGGSRAAQSQHKKNRKDVCLLYSCRDVDVAAENNLK